MLRIEATRSRQPFGSTRPPARHVALLLLLLGAACATAANESGIRAYQTPDGAWHRGGKDVTLPKPLELVPPAFPVEMRRAENLGRVLLEIEVSAEGKVVRAEVVKSISPASDAEAVRTVKRWKYEPARHRGAPVAVRKGACVTFQTKQS